jgi:Acyltransferase family
MKIHFLQTARAIAAWLVIAAHALLELSHNAPDSRVTHLAWSLGSAGVYVFFVISGFIMVHICWESFGSRAASVGFLRRASFALCHSIGLLRSRPLPFTKYRPHTERRRAGPIWFTRSRLFPIPGRRALGHRYCRGAGR